jgi:hypothetical protein
MSLGQKAQCRMEKGYRGPLVLGEPSRRTVLALPVLNFCAPVGKKILGCTKWFTILPVLVRIQQQLAFPVTVW